MIIHVCRNLNLTQKQFHSFLEFFNSHQHIIDSKIYINISRNLASMIFAIKEITEFLRQKFPDGTYVYTCKTAFVQLNRCSQLLEKLDKEKK